MGQSGNGDRAQFFFCQHSSVLAAGGAGTAWGRDGKGGQPPPGASVVR